MFHSGRTYFDEAMKNIRAVFNGHWMVTRKSPNQPADDQSRIRVNFEDLVASFRENSDIRQ